VIDESIVTGRLVAFVRISSLHSELDSQKEIIARFATRVGGYIRQWYEDPDRPRWKAEHSLVLKQLQADAAERQFDWIILDKQSRLGTMNHFEFFAYMQHFIAAGVRVWSVADGELTSGDIVTSIRSVASSQSEVEDQKNKAGNVARGMFMNVKRFRYNGAIMPYGYDRICKSSEGVERFRLVEESRTDNPGYVRGSKRPGEGKFLVRYTVVYPNGHSESLASPPGKGPHDYYEYAVTIRSERISAVREVFQLYADGMNLTEIANYMNNSGVDKGRRRFWSAASISSIITCSLYAGVYEWKKVSVAAYRTIGKDGQYMDAKWSKANPGSRKKVVDAEDRITADHAREDLRLVDQKLIEKARRKRDREQAKWKGRSAASARKNSHWLRDFMRCGACGGVMRQRESSQYKSQGKYSYFACGEYMQSRSVMDDPACKSVKVRQDIVEQKLVDFLTIYDRKIEADLGASRPKLDSLTLSLADKGSVIGRMRDEMVEYVLDRLPTDQHHVLDVEGGLSLVEAYRHYYNAEVAEKEKELRAIEDKIAETAVARVGLPSGGIADKKLMEIIHSLESDAEHLRSSIVPLDRRIDQVVQEYEQVRATVKSIVEHTMKQGVRKAAEELSLLLKAIEVHCVDTGYGKSRAKNMVTDRLVFVPAMGDPVEFKLEWTKKFRPETAARARELLDQQEKSGEVDLRLIAETLRAEGHECGSDKSWGARTVFRLLAGRLDVLPPSAKGPRPGTPRKDRGSRDA